MCKIFAMTNVSQVKFNRRFVGIVRDEVCRLSDKDGFGYAVLDNEGNIGGERTIMPKSFRPLGENPADRVVYKSPIVLKSSNMFGHINVESPKSFIAHGRLSTNKQTIENTHPYTNGEVALIHNGVVQDSSNLIKNLVTDNDTEILLRYWERGGIKEIEQHVSGYYALAILDKKGLLHIARDNKAMLYMTYCRTVDSFIIATTVDIIKNVAKRMKWNIEQPEQILDNTYAIFNGNDIVSYESISPIKTSTTMGYSARKALGYGGAWGYGGDEWEGYGTSENYDRYEGFSGAGGTATSSSNFTETAPEEETPPSYKEECKEALERDSFYAERFQAAEEEQGCTTFNDDGPEDDEALGDVVDQINKNLIA